MTGVPLRSETMEARISLVGAELRSLRHERHGEIMWQGDPAYWDRTSPLLFPVIGRVAGDRIRVGDFSYPMPQHGFAQALRFEVVERTTRTCLLAAEDSPLTWTSYPFPFRLEVSYSVSGSALSIETTVVNTGKGVLPASFGYHPGFRWPLEPGLAKSDHEICFPDDRTITVARPLQTLLGPDRTEIPLPEGVLTLDEAEFARGAMIVLSPNSKSVRFGSRTGTLSVEVGFQAMTSLGIWMRPGGDFLCIEPWHGHADPLGFAGGFLVKPGLDHIGEKSSKTYGLSISLHERGKDADQIT